jgi:hypothetical protein
MNLACPTCSITLQAEADLAGKTVKCPGCGGRIQIPEDFGAEAHHEESGVDAGEEMADQYYENLPELDISSTPIGPHPSHVNIWIAGGIGVMSALVWYVVMHLMPEGNYLRDLFTERGKVQYATTLLMFWCLGILVLKAVNIRKQRRAMLIQALPESIDEEITPNNLKEFHDNLINFPKPLRNTYIVNRIRKALEFFYVRQNNPEVAQMITSQSEVDAAKVGGSYSMVKVFLWAIPIMGFIGTVVGIGGAIGGFDAVLGAGEGGDMSAIKEPLTKVLGDMGVAFDTTLLALVFSIILSFPASALQNQEDDLVTDTDEYCIDNLLKRLNDGGANSNLGSDASLLKAVGDAIATNQKDIMGRFEGVQKDMSKNLSSQVEHHGKVAETIDRQLEAIDQRTKDYESKLDKEFFDSLDKMRIQSVGAIENQVGTLAEGIKNLNDVLKDLNGKQITVKKRGLFGR